MQRRDNKISNYFDNKNDDVVVRGYKIKMGQKMKKINEKTKRKIM